MLSYAFGVMDTGVKFSFWMSSGLFQPSVVQSLSTNRVTRALLFDDDVALVATSLEETQGLVKRFSVAGKAFDLTINIKKRK